jgi:hypothetical protein
MTELWSWMVDDAPTIVPISLGVMALLVAWMVTVVHRSWQVENWCRYQDSGKFGWDEAKEPEEE